MPAPILPPDRAVSRRRWLAGVLMATVLVSAGAAEPAPAFPPGSTPHFRHLGPDDGLASSYVYGVVQDQAGYIWIATDNGLQRYDGYRFKGYVHDSRVANSLAENVITGLAFAQDGSLWVGTQDAGLDRLAPDSGTFTHYTHDPENADSLGDDQVSALLRDQRGHLWIGTNAGLDRLDAGATRFHHYRTGSKQPNGERILAVYEDDDGRIWVGSDHGVFWYDAAHDALVRFTPAGGPALAAARGALSSDPIQAFCRAHDGRLWIGTEHGLAALSRDGAVLAFYSAQHGGAGLASDHIRDLLEDDSGLWITTLHGGLSRLDYADGRFTSYQHDPADSASLSDDDLGHLFRDRRGLLWMGSYSGGINIYNPRTRAFGYYRARPGRADGLAANLVWSVYKAPSGDLWVGSVGGLTRLDRARREYRQYDLHDQPSYARDDKVVNAIQTDADGNLWVGTDYGVSRYLPARDGFEFHKLVEQHGDPYQTSVTVLFTDAAHRMWIGAQKGLMQFDPRSGRVLRRFLPDPVHPDSLPNGLVTALCQTTDGALWVGTAAGLGKLDTEQGKFLVYTEGNDPARSIASNSILSCLGTPDGHLWVGTDNGLDDMDPKSGAVHHYGLAEGLPDITIFGLARDAHGDIWFSTSKGITRLSKTTGLLRSYGPADGLQKGGFDSGAAFAAADGELFFGGEQGLNSFYPDRLPPDPLAPAVAVTRFSALGKPVAVPADGMPRIAYRQNILTFDFTAFDYADPGANRFRYLLDGFDDEPHVILGERSITYTNLDPGRYELRVEASNDGVNWSTAPARLAFQVLPPPWRSWWAYTLYVLALLTGGIAVFAVFGRSVQRRQIYLEERNRRRWAEALHQLIQAVTVLEDETAIASCLLDSLVKFIEYDRSLFYVERDNGLILIGCRGGDAVEQLYHERWPSAHVDIALRLRHEREPRLLTPEEAATLEPAGQAPRHYLSVPLLSGNSAFRLLLVGRASKTIQPQGLDIAAAMAKQVSVALDKARLIKDLENLATTDGLTRLYNRRTFLQRAESEFERSRRYQRPLSVLMLDVDHFKNVNDGYGHETGDRVLRVLADACRKSLRQQDVIGRYGGEEFVAFLPETPAETALEVAERLRESVAALGVASPTGVVKVTVSIGLATASRTTAAVAQLINDADQAMYEAKQQGRNRVVVSG